MGVKCNVTHLGFYSNSILHPFSAIITPYTDFDFYGVLQQHSNFNSVAIKICSYETLAIRLFQIYSMYIWRGYNLAQENYSGFNVCNWYFLKYQMWQFGQFFKIRSQISSDENIVCTWFTMILLLCFLLAKIVALLSQTLV